MGDLRTAVARAIRQADVDFFEQEGSSPLIASELNPEGLIEFTEALADAAIAVAEPIIRADERRKVIDSILAKLDSEEGPFVMFSPTYEVEDDMIQRKTFADWLRAQETPHE